MFLLDFRRKLTALALCKSIESAIQWFQIHHRITFATIQNPAVYLSGARVSIFSTLVPRLLTGLRYNLCLSGCTISFNSLKTPLKICLIGLIHTEKMTSSSLVVQLKLKCLLKMPA